MALKTVSNGVFNTTANGSGLHLGWTIFNGFNVVRLHIKNLDELNQIGQLNTQLTVENLIADIVSGYYNYILQVQHDE